MSKVDIPHSEKVLRSVRYELKAFEGECQHVYKDVLPLLKDTPRVENRKIAEYDLRMPHEEIDALDGYSDLEKSMFLLGYIEGISRVGTHVESIIDAKEAPKMKANENSFSRPQRSFWAPEEENAPDFKNFMGW